MTTITLAGNFIDLTDFAVLDEDGETRGWGHLQLVKDGNEIEVQAPIDFWINASLTVGPLAAFILGTWEFPRIGTSGNARLHGDSNNTPNYQVDGKYGEVVLDVAYEGSDRTEEDIWSLWSDIHQQISGQASIHYSANQNSNSYVGTLLWMLGIDGSDEVASLVSSIDTVVEFPGYGYNPLDEHTIDFDLTGTDNGDVLYTGIGNDKLVGAGGDDQFWSGGGADTLVGGTGNDLLNGEGGSDLVDYSGLERDTDAPVQSGIAATLIAVENPEAGQNSFFAQVTDPWGDTDTLLNVENIIGTEFNDIFAISGSLADVTSDLDLIDARGNTASGDTLDLSDVTDESGVMINLQQEFIQSNDNAFGAAIITGFENVIGTDQNDFIIGNDQANILDGGSGADMIDGGEGIDLLDFSGAEMSQISDPFGGAMEVGVELSLDSGIAGVAAGDTYTNVEAVRGSAFSDFFHISGGGIFAGGEDNDVFNVTGGSGVNGPAVLWGGSGADFYAFETGSPTGIVVANVSNLTEENFQFFDYRSLSAPSGFDWSAIDAVIINPDASDLISVTTTEFNLDGSSFRDSEIIGTGTSTVSAIGSGKFGVRQLHEPTVVADVEIQTSAKSEQISQPLRYADHVSSYDVSFLTGSSFAVFASAAQVGFFLESQSRFKSDDPEPLITTGNLIVTSSGTNQLSVGTADFSVEIEIPENPEIPFIHNTIDYYAWLHFRYFVDGEPVGGTSSGNGFVFTTAVEDIPTFENVEDIGDWFIAGASLDGTSIVSNGSFSTTIQVPGAADSADSSQTQSANAGSNQTNFGASFGGVGTTTTYSGFNAGVGALVVSGAPINPNAPPIDVTISQAGNDVLVSGATASLILQDVQLSEWQAVASTQLLGTSGTDDITGSSAGELIAGGSGSDTVNGAAGDDTISYLSGDDVINGGAGQDRVDLSQYGSDEISFRISGNDVLIDTPDGTINLQRQVRYELGHSHSNIETLQFADVVLDAAAMRQRALDDQATVGDDVITGSLNGDLFIASVGNDTVNAGGGNDTISYLSGDDVIVGDAGNDTLDLQQYGSLEVSFRISGHDVLIDTPDGTINLQRQVRYELGHTYSNIETLQFADVVLDDAAIRQRALDDQATASDDVITGSLNGDLFIASVGNDTVNAGGGDDTISYLSGDDVIVGAAGNDTLDLQQYGSLEVSFRISGHDVLIDTPDGTINLQRQVRYELGHIYSNIETLQFADVVLDDAAIRQRALDDQATAGDDEITGTLLHGDVLTTGGGNDVVSGLGGSDVFAFRSGDGHDTIADFEYGTDFIRFSGGPVGMSDLSLVQAGNDAIISYSGQDAVLILNLSVAQLTQEDFQFV